jgi:hypothetical protein
MTKHKVSELQGKLLDSAVAKAEGLLQQAYQHYDELRAVRARLQLQGVADRELPGQPVLQHRGLVRLVVG